LAVIVAIEAEMSSLGGWVTRMGIPVAGREATRFHRFVRMATRTRRALERRRRRSGVPTLLPVISKNPERADDSRENASSTDYLRKRDPASSRFAVSNSRLALKRLTAAGWLSRC